MDRQIKGKSRADRVAEREAIKLHKRIGAKNDPLAVKKTVIRDNRLPWLMRTYLIVKKIVIRDNQLPWLTRTYLQSVCNKSTNFRGLEKVNQPTSEVEKFYGIASTFGQHQRNSQG